MHLNNSVTIYHFDDDTGTYSKSIYKAYTFETKKHQSSSSVNSSGEEDKSVLIVRIPTSDTLDIMPGDRVVTGICNDEIPPKGGFWRVVLTGDRRIGFNPHWRLECE